MNLWNSLVQYKNWVLAILGSFLLVLFGLKQKKQGKLELENMLLKQKEKALEQASKAGAKEKRDTAGLSDRDIADRLRGRNDDWGRM